MESLWSYLPTIAVLACPIGMALMMWFMGRSNGQGMCGMNMTSPTQPAADKDAQITELQEQLQTMKSRCGLWKHLHYKVRNNRSTLGVSKFAKRILM
jgi:hypothetical protein